MKAITLLGSTGSIGTQTLDIVATHPDRFELVGIAAGNNVELLAQQVRQFKPKIVAIRNSENSLNYGRRSPILIPNLRF